MAGELALCRPGHESLTSAKRERNLSPVPLRHGLPGDPDSLRSATDGHVEYAEQQIPERQQAGKVPVAALGFAATPIWSSLPS